jgi:hypothetical protein
MQPLLRQQAFVLHPLPARSRTAVASAGIEVDARLASSPSPCSSADYTNGFYKFEPSSTV